MTKQKWKSRIKKACVEVETYKKSFDGVIDALADILEKRDQALEQYDGNPIISHTNSHGETNRMKSPALMLWDELNKTALSYWRDLGLTPKGLKAINEEAMEKKKVSSLAEVLKNIGR